MKADYRFTIMCRRNARRAAGDTRILPTKAHGAVQSRREIMEAEQFLADVTDYFDGEVDDLGGEPDRK